MQKLSEIAIGKEYIIQEIMDTELAQKLLEMGCTPGEKIVVERKAPFNDPIAIIVSGFMLSIRQDDAKQIIVKEAIS
ncbi:MAG: ferrous iron transport protein A [Flavobacteriales bacterium]|nr:ferrous iron transport protein A [Flavobacteriales bacterium]